MNESGPLADSVEPPVEDVSASRPPLPATFSGSAVLELVISKHARRRTSQRGISSDRIELAAMLGTRIDQDGATLFFLGRRQLDRRDISSRDRERLEGLTVIVSRDGAVITAYRNRNGVAGRLRRRGHRGASFRRQHSNRR